MGDVVKSTRFETVNVFKNKKAKRAIKIIEKINVSIFSIFMLPGPGHNSKNL